MRYAAVAILVLIHAIVAASVRAAPIDDLPPPIVTRQAVFSIPFTVPALDASQHPSEVRLLASGDRGANWPMTDRIDLRAQRLPYKGGFTFRAPADGEYWFAIRTVDRTGQMRSDMGSSPELRVIVDTRPPRLEFNATRGQAGEIVVRWQTVDPNLKPESLKLQYQSTGNPRWQTIAVDGSATDAGRSAITNSATWWPRDAAGLMTIKAEVSDSAGNTTVVQAQVDLQQPLRPAGDQRGPLTTSINRSLLAEPARNTVAPAAEKLAPGFARGAEWPADVLTERPLGRGSSEGQRAAHDAPHDAGRINGATSEVGPIQGPALGPSPDGRIRPSGQSLDREIRGTESVVHPPVGNQYVSPANRPQRSIAPDNSSAQDSKLAAAMGETPGSAWYFDRGGSGIVPAGDALSARGMRAGSFDFALPPGEHLRMVNSTAFELDYEVESVGRSGISKVELWVTRDGGRTWTSMGVDRDNRSPIRTTVDGEGVYGYRMTVESGSGLGGRPPKPGDLPEVWIGVDLTRPTARLISAEAGAGDRAGEIVIRYEANDALLADRPIALVRSAQPGGPWTTIAAGLDNSGQYHWRFDNTVADRVYLRLEVRDEAGNVGAFEAADPISLDRVLPQGRLRDVRPVDEAARPDSPQAARGRPTAVR